MQRQKITNIRIRKENIREANLCWRPVIFTRIQIFAPKYLDIFDGRNYMATVEFLDKIRHNLLIRARQIYLRFDKIEFVSAAAMILLVAEVQRCQFVRGISAIKANYPKNQKMEQVFQQIGFLDLLGKRARQDERLFPDDVCYWRYSSGKLVDMEIIAPMLEKIGEYFPLDVDNPIYRGVSEAITNCHQHAYSINIQESLPFGEKRWWLFGQVREDKLTLVACDLGVGIPKTLPIQHKFWFEAALRRMNLRSMTDGYTIRAAMELKKTSTGLPNRGKGLADLERSVHGAKGAALWIFSNRGRYVYNERPADATREAMALRVSTTDFKKSIGGTVITWSWPLNSADHQPEHGLDSSD